jgi:hypothetical protein
MIAALFAGCGKPAEPPQASPDAENTASPTPEASVTPTAFNIAGAYASLVPTTVMLSINGADVTWDEFFYYIHSAINEIKSSGYEISSLSDVYMDDMTYSEYILSTATDFALQNAAIQYGAGQLNVALADTDNAAIQADWDARVDSSGSEEALITQLKANYGSKELLMELLGLSYLAQNCFAELYGTDGSKLSDEEAADNTAQDGYLMAKHILMLTTKTDEAGNKTPLSDTEKADVRAKMDEILSQLRSYEGNDFDAYFDELMTAYSEDPGGLAMFPNGYLFQEGDMVSAFFDATKALEIGACSDIVESDFGFHIIYRMPINYDVTPIMYSDYGAYTLRFITAQNMFGAVFDTWLNSLNVSYSEEYKALDMEKLFTAG